MSAVPFSSRFQSNLNDLHRETLPASPRRRTVTCGFNVMVLIAALVFGVFLTDAGAQRPPIANMAKQKVNSKAAAQQQAQSSVPANPQDPSIGVPTRVLMPDLISPRSTFDKAVAELKERKVTVDERREEYSSDVEIGNLLAQFPKAGTPLTPDPYIMLVVSKGPDPYLSATDLSVEVTLQTKEPYSERQAVQYNILVKNLGRVMAKDVRVVAAPKNLRLDSFSTPCTDANNPCIIPTIEPGKPVTINVTASILQAGDFDNIVTVKGSEIDPDPANNIDFAGNGGTVPIKTPEPPRDGTEGPDPERFPWEWILLGAGGGVLTGGIITKALWPGSKPHPDPKIKTPRGPASDIYPGPATPSIDTYVDLETGPSYCDPFPINGPPLSLTADLELGQMQIDEHIQILKEEVVNEST